MGARTSGDVLLNDCVQQTGSSSSPQNVRKTTVKPGNQEYKGREQLDQVSPLYIDSFFPFVWLRKEFVSTVSVLEDLWQPSQRRGIKRPARFGDDCCAMLSFEEWKTEPKGAKFLRNTGAILKKKIWMPQRMFGGVTGEFSAAICSFLRTRHICANSVNVKAQKTCVVVLLFK